jgi:hypothetical protein
MANVIIIFASNAHAETPQLGASDRAAIGLAISRFSEPAAGFCPDSDTVAMNYGVAAKVPDVSTLSSPEIPEFDVALVGQCALGEFGADFAGVLAETRSATLVFDVLDVHREGDDLRIIKDIGHGSREEWVVSGPVVLVIAAEAVRPPYVSRYRRTMAARNRLSAESFQHPAAARPAMEWESVRPRAKVNRGAQLNSGLAEDRMSAAFGISAAASAGANDWLIVADAATCARHLIRYLAHHGFLPENLAGKSPPEREVNLAVAESSKRQLVSAASSNISMSQRAARGPRFPNDSPQRLARRPRTMQGVSGQSTASIPLPRCPRPIGRTTSGLARRPRKTAAPGRAGGYRSVI